MLEYLRDGACCACVFVKARAAEVARILGDARALVEDGKVVGRATADEPPGLVLQAVESDWSVVELRRAPDPDPARYPIDSAPLVEQASVVVNGSVPDVPLDYTAPVTVAQRLGERLGVESAGVWGSDQGPGIGGGAFFEGGRLEEALSAASPEELGFIRRAQASDDDPEAEAQLELLQDAEEERSWRFVPGTGGMPVQGCVDDLVDARLAERGAPLEIAEDPVWSWLRALGEAPDSVTGQVRSLHEVTRLEG